jgi:D-sedoheptulose 7-phosphate isomerase
MILDEVIEELQSLAPETITHFHRLIGSFQNIIILGNGGSNAIASHISQDYTKKLGKKSFCFSDPARLTCYINDYGMENAYVQFLKEFVTSDSLVILVSSSGESKNIIKCAQFCQHNNIGYVILTGFNQFNTLRTTFKENSQLDIWVDSEDYGVVECVHQIFLHLPC